MANHEELRYHFSNLQILQALESLAAENPELAKQLWNEDPTASAALAEFNNKKSEMLKPAATEKKPAAAPAPKRRGGFDPDGETTKKAAAVLRGLSK